MNMTEMMKQLSERGLAPDSYEKPVRPSRLVRRETFSAYKSVAEERETWSKSAHAKLGRSPSGTEDDT